MAFALTCLYVFVLFLRPQDWLVPGLAPLRPLDVVTVLAVGTAILQLMQHELSLPVEAPHFRLMLGLFVGVLMSHVAHTYFAGMQMAFEDFGKTVIVFCLVLTTTTNLRRLRILTGIYVLVAFAVAIHCILQWRTGHGFAGEPPLVMHPGTDQESVRAQFFGIFSDPNDTSLLLVTAMPMTAFLLPVNRFVTGVAAMGLMGTLLVGIYTTQSRGGFVAFGVMMLTFMRRYMQVRWFILFAAIGVVLLTTIAPARFAQSGMMDGSATERVSMWGEANWLFKQNPLFGVGYLMLTDYLPHGMVVHNSYVQTYTELGVFGYVFWFGLLAVSFVSCWQIGMLQPESPEDRNLLRFANLMVPALAGMYAAAYFLTRNYHLPVYVWLAMCGVAYRLAARKVGVSEFDRICGMQPATLWRWPALALGSIAFIYASILVANKLRG